MPTYFGQIRSSGQSVATWPKPCETKGELHEKENHPDGWADAGYW